MTRRWKLVPTLAAVFAFAGCSESTTPVGAPVELRAAAAAQPSAASVSAARVALGSADLEVTSLRLMVGEVGLGYGDEFGCIDCEGDFEDENAAPRVVDVPLNGGTVLLETEMASPGTYSEMEISLERSASPPADWPSQATIQVGGTYAGKTFTIDVSVEGSSRQSLETPVVVTDLTSTSLNATVQFPVIAWFTDSTGGQLDPTDPTERAAIEANIRAYFAASEDPE